jgi:hypothetical protein
VTAAQGGDLGWVELAAQKAAVLTRASADPAVPAGETQALDVSVEPAVTLHLRISVMLTTGERRGMP